VWDCDWGGELWLLVEGGILDVGMYVGLVMVWAGWRQGGQVWPSGAGTALAGLPLCSFSLLFRFLSCKHHGRLVVWD